MMSASFLPGFRKPSVHIGIVALIIAVCLLVLGLEAWPTWQSRTSAIEGDKVETSNLARSLAQHAHDSVRIADTVLLGLRERAETDGLGTANRERMHQIMVLYAAHLPMVDGLFIYDAAGNWVVNSRLARFPAGLNNADRAYFQYHRDHADRGPHIDRPVRSKIDGRWILPVSRRIDNPDGSFGGVVLATLSIDFLQRFYQTFDTEAGGAIALDTADGILIARNPADDRQIGTDVSKGAILRGMPPAVIARTVEYTSALDGIRRFGSARRVEDYPLIVLVSHSVSAVLSDWYSSALRYLTIGGIAAVSVIFLGLRVAHQVKVREEAERRYRLLADYSTDAIVCATLSGRRTYVSPSFTSLTGWSREESLSFPWGSIVHPEDRPRFDQITAALHAGAEQVTCCFRYQCKSGDAVWVEARIQMLPESRNGEVQLIANIRDITKRKIAEDAVEALNRELSAQALTDALTGLGNRRCFDKTLQMEWARAARTSTCLSLLMVDLDRFKLYNDRYGHQQGDACLRLVADTIIRTVQRQGDIAVRYGGEELALILPNTDAAGAKEVAERLRAAVEAIGLEHWENGPWGCVTASIGAATATPKPNGRTGGSDLVAQADWALYEAKRVGRNTVVASRRPRKLVEVKEIQHAL
jgi:diguanylate cyclase (GGDEF)-like protein/PAS domain S-box-containing protein